MELNYRFLTCPDCGRRSVYFKQKHWPIYVCRYTPCAFTAFTACDEANLWRLVLANVDLAGSE